MRSSQKTLPELSLKSYVHGTPEQKTEFARALKESFIEYGFVILKDQDSVSPKILSDAYSVMQGFYAQSTAEKCKYIDKGYTPFGVENAKGNPVADLKEFWHVGQFNIPKGETAQYYHKNVWPDFPGFKETFSTLYQGLESIGLVMLEALASQIDPGSSYLQDMPRQGRSVLRLLHYPPIEDSAPPNAMRAAAHEDINLITLLVAANGKGLQLLTRDNEWMDVNTDPNNIIVDAGDMLAHITGHKIPATTHRVVNIGDLSKSRYSIPFFMHPRPDCILRPLDNFCDNSEEVTPITARESLEIRLREIGLL